MIVGIVIILLLFIGVFLKVEHELTSAIGVLRKENKQLKARVELLEERVKLLQKKVFGPTV